MGMHANQPFDADGFWQSVLTLLDAGRWLDASVTVHSVADETGLLGLRVTFGTLLAERGRDYDAICEWTLAIDLAQKSGNGGVLAAIYHNLSAIYRDVGDHGLARRFQQRAMQLQADCGPDDLLHLANDALTAKRWTLAESLVETAAEMTHPEDPLLGDIAATRGLLYALRHNPRTGIEWLKQAYRHHRLHRDDAGAVRDLMNLAALYEQTNRLSAARKRLRQAALLCSRTALPRLAKRLQNQQTRVERLFAVQQHDLLAN